MFAQVGASEDMKKTRSYGGLRVFGVVVCGFASSGWRAGEVRLDSLAQDGELAKFGLIR